MYDILTTIQGIVFLITILVCIPGGIWIINSLTKKRWKRVAIQVTIAATVYACLAGLSAICSSKIHADYLTGLYDADVKLGPAIFKYEPERAGNGDGYSISVYKLSAAIRKLFESADDRLMTEYPKLPGDRHNYWKVEHWREAPFVDKFKQRLDFALKY